jgi:hypothetical protein
MGSTQDAQHPQPRRGYATDFKVIIMHWLIRGLLVFIALMVFIIP